jgi:endonuclease YncB( thermonuclease family)
MAERVKWLYLLVGLVLGGGAVLAFERFPGGRRQSECLEFRYEEGQTYRVQHVFDGDTIVVEPGIRLRYAGINAPETSRFVEEPQPFGLEAKEANQRLVAGRLVRLTVANARFDKYGRLLAGVEVQDPETGRWLDVEEELVKAGLARRVSYAGPVRNEIRLRNAEEAARAAGAGLWPGSGSKSAPAAAPVPTPAAAPKQAGATEPQKKPL